MVLQIHVKHILGGDNKVSELCKKVYYNWTQSLKTIIRGRGTGQPRKQYMLHIIFNLHGTITIPTQN